LLDQLIKFASDWRILCWPGVRCFACGQGDMHKRKDSRVPNFQTFQLGVPCIGPVTPDCGAFVVKELFKHFLYMRSQLPQVFDQLLWQYQARIDGALREGQGDDSEDESNEQRPHKKPRVTSSQRKLDKTTTAAQALLEHLSPQLLSTQERWWISFLFGPSPQRPHESYEVLLNIKGAAGEAFKEQQSRRLAKRVLLSLIEMSPNMPEGRASKGGTKVFVMIRCPSMTEAPPGFVPKRGFQFNSKRGLQVVMDLSDSQALQNEGEGAATLLDGMQIEDPAAGSPVCATPRCGAQRRHQPKNEDGGVEMVWYQCRQSVAGYYTKPQNSEG